MIAAENIDDKEITKVLQELRDKFPRDPRVWLFSSLVSIDKSQWYEVEKFARQGLAQKDILNSFYYRDQIVEVHLRIALAEVLRHYGRSDEIAEIIKPVCPKIIMGSYTFGEEIASLCGRVSN